MRLEEGSPRRYYPMNRRAGRRGTESVKSTISDVRNTRHRRMYSPLTRDMDGWWVALQRQHDADHGWMKALMCFSRV